MDFGGIEASGKKTGVMKGGKKLTTHQPRATLGSFLSPGAPTEPEVVRIPKIPPRPGELPPLEDPSAAAKIVLTAKEEEERRVLRKAHAMPVALSAAMSTLGTAPAVDGPVTTSGVDLFRTLVSPYAPPLTSSIVVSKEVQEDGDETRNSIQQLIATAEKDMHRIALRAEISKQLVGGRDRSNSQLCHSDNSLALIQSVNHRHSGAGAELAPFTSTGSPHPAAQRTRSTELAIIRNPQHGTTGLSSRTPPPRLQQPTHKWVSLSSKTSHHQQSGKPQVTPGRSITEVKHAHQKQLQQRERERAMDPMAKLRCTEEQRVDDKLAKVQREIEHYAAMIAESEAEDERKMTTSSQRRTANTIIQEWNLQMQQHPKGIYETEDERERAVSLRRMNRSSKKFALEQEAADAKRQLMKKVMDEKQREKEENRQQRNKKKSPSPGGSQQQDGGAAEDSSSSSGDEDSLCLLAQLEEKEKAAAAAAALLDPAKNTKVVKRWRLPKGTNVDVYPMARLSSYTITRLTGEMVLEEIQSEVANGSLWVQVRLPETVETGTLPSVAVLSQKDLSTTVGEEKEERENRRRRSPDTRKTKKVPKNILPEEEEVPAGCANKGWVVTQLTHDGNVTVQLVLEATDAVQDVQLFMLDECDIVTDRVEEALEHCPPERLHGEEEVKEILLAAQTQRQRVRDLPGGHYKFIEQTWQGMEHSSHQKRLLTEQRIAERRNRDLGPKSQW